MNNKNQLNLFQTQENVNDNIHYKRIHRDLATFKSGEDKPVHRWFRLTPSFGPDLVNIVLNEFNYSNDSIVLDPFSGAGTTLIECQLNNIKSYGFEINPFLYHVCNISLTSWDLNIELLIDLKESINLIFNNYKDKWIKKKYDELGINIPLIHNVERWWRPDVLKDLLILKQSIIEATNNKDQVFREFFLFVIAGILVPDLTNVTLGKLQLHFINRDNDIIEVLKRYNQHIDLIISDLIELKKKSFNKNYSAKILNVDSTTIKPEIIDGKVDIVITSPPYPNRYSYVWNTRPYLYFFDLFSTPKEASDLDKKTIGGTWGTATSILSKGKIEPLNNIVHDCVTDIVELIRKEDNLMANYVMKYFNLLTLQVIKMNELLSKEAKLAYVVGVSDIKDIRVNTDEILANIFSKLHYNSKVMRFRKRNSGKDLYESIVFGYK